MKFQIQLPFEDEHLKDRINAFTLRLFRGTKMTKRRRQVHMLSLYFGVVLLFLLVCDLLVFKVVERRVLFPAVLVCLIILAACDVSAGEPGAKWRRCLAERKLLSVSTEWNMCAVMHDNFGEADGVWVNEKKKTCTIACMGADSPLPVFLILHPASIKRVPLTSDLPVVAADLGADGIIVSVSDVSNDKSLSEYLLSYGLPLKELRVQENIFRAHIEKSSRYGMAVRSSLQKPEEP